MLEVPGGRGIFSTVRFSTSARAPISTVISLHCVSLDSILLRLSSAGKSWARRRIRVNIGVSSFSPTFSALPPLSFFGSPIAARPPLSLFVGVNLSPRLSPNTELYKLKPISLPGLGSSYSGHFIFVYLLSANMPGLLRSSQATDSGGGGDILLARLVTRQGFLLRMRMHLYEFLSCIREGLRIIRVALTCARLFHLYQNIRVSTCARLRRYSSVYVFDLYIYKRCSKTIRYSFKKKSMDCRKYTNEKDIDCFYCSDNNRIFK